MLSIYSFFFLYYLGGSWQIEETSSRHLDFRRNERRKKENKNCA